MTKRPQTDPTATRGARRKPAPVDPDLLDDEPDKPARLGAYSIVLVALLVSADMLIYVAREAGWHGIAGYAMPFLIDVAGGIAGRVAYRRKRTRPSTRRYAKWIVYATLVASCVGNLVGHAIKTGLYHPGPELVIVTSLVAPVIAATVLHLTMLLSPAGRTAPVAVPVQTDQTGSATLSEPASLPDSKPAPKPDSKPESGPDQVDEPDRTTPDRTEESGPARTVVPDDEAVRKIRELDAAAGEPVSDRTIRAELGCGASRAKKLAEQARAIHLAA